MHRTPTIGRRRALVGVASGLVPASVIAFSCAAAPPVLLPDPEVGASGSIGQSLLLHPSWVIAGATSRRTEQPSGTMTTGAITLWPRAASGDPGLTPFSIVGATPRREQAFGAAIALAGDTLLVGAPNWDQSASAQFAGRVHVFDLASDTPVELGTIGSSSPVVASQFGASLAAHTDGSTIRAAIGAPGFASSSGGPPRGRVSLVERVGSGWTVLAEWLAPGNLTYTSFGFAVAMNEADVAVGAPLSGTAAAPAEGRVYLYAITDPVAEPAVLTAPNATLDDHFGHALAMTESLLVVGAPAGECDSGKAYLYRASRKGWTLEATLEPPVTGEGTDPDLDGWLGFGSSVAIDRERVAVGSGAVGSAERLGQKSAIFRRSGSAWVLERVLDATDAILPQSGAGGQIAIDPAGVVIDLPLVEGLTKGSTTSALRYEPLPASADLDFDGLVGAADLAALLGAWGTAGPHPADLSGNGVVDAADLAILIGAWS